MKEIDYTVESKALGTKKHYEISELSFFDLLFLLLSLSFIVWKNLQNLFPKKICFSGNPL